MPQSDEASPAAGDIIIAQPEHALYCFDVLVHKLQASSRSSSESALEPRFHNGDDAYPLFVTWNIRGRGGGGRTGNYRLRGCLGRFSALPLRKGLREFALKSALTDDRFDPIDMSEVPRLQCGVSLLTHFENCKDAFDWTLGKHGIWVHFSPPGSSAGSGTSTRPASGNKRQAEQLSATFLPDVPGQVGWNQLQTLEAAVRKAGYRGKIDKALLDSLQVQRYQSAKVSVTYEEWQQARGMMPQSPTREE